MAAEPDITVDDFYAQIEAHHVDQVKDWQAKVEPVLKWLGKRVPEARPVVLVTVRFQTN
jgi:hypothetical protein